MSDRALLQQALHALEKYALDKEEKLIRSIRDQLSRPAREPVTYVLGNANRMSLDKLNPDLKTKRSRTRSQA